MAATLAPEDGCWSLCLWVLAGGAVCTMDGCLSLGLQGEDYGRRLIWRGGAVTSGPTSHAAPHPIPYPHPTGGPAAWGLCGSLLPEEAETQAGSYGLITKRLIVWASLAISPLSHGLRYLSASWRPTPTFMRCHWLKPSWITSKPGRHCQTMGSLILSAVLRVPRKRYVLSGCSAPRHHY